MSDQPSLAMLDDLIELLTEQATDPNLTVGDRYITLAIKALEELKAARFEIEVLGQSLSDMYVEILRLEKALEFYANEDTYLHWTSSTPNKVSPTDVTIDRGKIAREALRDE